MRALHPLKAAQKILCPGHGFDVFGRRYSASMHIRRISVRTLPRPMTTPSPRNRSRRVVQMQCVNPPLDRQLSLRYRLWFVVRAAPAEPQQRRLPCQRQVMGPVDHRFALSRPALLSAPDKKSFSKVSSPILA
jgi:hypothetical protein